MTPTALGFGLLRQWFVSPRKEWYEQDHKENGTDAPSPCPVLAGGATAFCREKYLGDRLGR